MFSVSRRVKFPALPEARMETRNPIGKSPVEEKTKTFKIMTEGGKSVNLEAGEQWIIGSCYEGR